VGIITYYLLWIIYGMLIRSTQNGHGHIIKVSFLLTKMYIFLHLSKVFTYSSTLIYILYNIHQINQLLNFHVDLPSSNSIILIALLLLGSNLNLSDGLGCCDIFPTSSRPPFSFTSFISSIVPVLYASIGQLY